LLQDHTGTADILGKSTPILHIHRLPSPLQGEGSSCMVAVDGIYQPLLGGREFLPNRGCKKFEYIKGQEGVGIYGWRNSLIPGAFRLRLILTPLPPPALPPASVHPSSITPSSRFWIGDSPEIGSLPLRLLAWPRRRGAGAPPAVECHWTVRLRRTSRAGPGAAGGQRNREPGLWYLLFHSTQEGAGVDDGNAAESL